ncbi:sugar transferase [Devosia sp. MC1541]|uniref:sugar transferase n=1 Tax=Devosia sp. MC1541 TaxID=2725264 RepID=UPI00145E2C50|nr:sugar transferase [Devosia sp. MC1541]
MSDQHSRNSSASAPLGHNLSYVVAQGGRMRRNRYLRELISFAAPTLITALLMACAYILTVTRAGRSDWSNIGTASIVLMLVPVLCTLILTGLRRHTAAILSATLVSVGLLSTAVTLLSALRLPISYQAILLATPILILGMAFANLRFQRTIRAHVALARFDQADAVASELGNIRIIDADPNALDETEILLIDPQAHHSEAWSKILATCYLRGIDIMPWAAYRETLLGRLEVASFEVSHLAYSSSQVLYARCKRLFDIVAVLASLPVTVPLALLVALYIGLRDGFPVIFVQNRRGYRGQSFRMYKFRTMYNGTEGGSTTHADSRIIPGCKLLRKLRFDELPQLYNILRGDMSLIGPRPVAEYVAESSASLEPKYALRCLVLPGITGWAQVRSGYAATDAEEIEKLSYDLYYIKHMSLDLDIYILFKTVRTVLFGAGR